MTPKPDKGIVFYAEHEGYFPNFEGLIHELTRRHQQTICYITSDAKDPILSHPMPRVHVFYSNLLLPFLMLFIQCKVFVMTLTDLNHFHLKRSLYPVHYVYVFHSLVSVHMAYRRSSFDFYDSLLLTGPYQEEEILEYETKYGLPRKKLIPAGYYRLERIYDQYKTHRISYAPNGKKTTVLIAPSWGDKNVIESCGEALVEILLQAGYQVIVRPHPETMRRKPQMVSHLIKKFGSNPSIIFEMSILTDDSLLKSDILISDGSGIALEYALGTERPVLFLDVPWKIRNPEYQNLSMEPIEITMRRKIGVTVPVSQLREVPRIIEDLKSKQDLYKQDLARLREKYVFAFGQSSQIGAKHIMTLVSRL